MLKTILDSNRKLFLKIKYIFDFKNNSKTLPPLGRWYISYDENISKKIDFANYDNCGLNNYYKK